MTVVGVGIDIVDVDAFAHQLDDEASAFVAATFTAAERRVPVADPDRGRRARHLAARFAAKEAFVKAWSGARRGRTPAVPDIDLREIEVVPDGYGRPGLRLRGRVAEAVLALGGDDEIHSHLSLTHDGSVAAAVVVLEIRQPR